MIKVYQWILLRFHSLLISRCIASLTNGTYFLNPRTIKERSDWSDWSSNDFFPCFFTSSFFLHCIFWKKRKDHSIFFACFYLFICLFFLLFLVYCGNVAIQCSIVSWKSFKKRERESDSLIWSLSPIRLTTLFMNVVNTCVVHLSVRRHPHSSIYLYSMVSEDFPLYP